MALSESVRKITKDIVADAGLSQWGPDPNRDLHIQAPSLDMNVWLTLLEGKKREYRHVLSWYI